MTIETARMSSSDTITSSPLRSLPRPRVKHVVHALYPSPRTHTLAPGPTTLGRLDAKLAFPEDRAISRLHAELVLVDGRVEVRDLGSHNGTWRNGERTARDVLADGDVLRLGDTFLLYRVEPVELVDADIPTVLGVSPHVRALRADLARVAPTGATVVLLGETGTGKTLAARAIHAASGRRGEFVHLNGAAIPENIAESLLFGHKAGAYTDARADSAGAFRTAHRGTLFFDEVALLSSATQARLLVAIESRAVTPVGANTPVPVDVRLLVATNEDLDAAVAAGRFRADLHARLAEVTLELPPLRRRREDLLLLLDAARGPKAPPFTPDAVDLLLRWPWPYNVREVEKLASELRIRGEGRTSIGAELLERFAEPAPPARDDLPQPPPSVDGPPDREALLALLREADGNVSELARRVGRSTKQVYRWCSRFGVDPAQFRG